MVHVQPAKWYLTVLALICYVALVIPFAWSAVKGTLSLRELSLLLIIHSTMMTAVLALIVLGFGSYSHVRRQFGFALPRLSAYSFVLSRIGALAFVLCVVGAVIGNDVDSAVRIGGVVAATAAVAGLLGAHAWLCRLEQRHDLLRSG